MGTSKTRCSFKFFSVVAFSLLIFSGLGLAQATRSGDVPIADFGKVGMPYRNSYVADRFGWNDDWGFSSASWSLSSEFDMVRLKSAGHSWVRYWIWWSELEPVEGNIDWTPVDDFFAKARKLNLKVYLSIFTAPAWATGGEPWAVWNHCLALPSGSRKYDFRDDLPECANPTKPLSEVAFRTFVRKVLERYPEVEYIGLWNEPSIMHAWPWAYKISGGENWLRLDCYRELAEQVYLPGYAEVKLVRPNIKVVGPDEYHDIGLGVLLALEREYAERGRGKFFDIISVHLYGASEKFPNDALKIFDEIFLPAIRGSAQPDRDVWVTESGFRWELGENLQAERLSALYEGVWARRENISKFFLYRHNEGSRPWHPEELAGFGIFRGIDGSARPAYFSIKDFMSKICGGVVETTPTPPR
jgi:hypothetical protein